MVKVTTPLMSPVFVIDCYYHRLGHATLFREEALRVQVYGYYIQHNQLVVMET
jgi:hypothetical protein